MNFEPARHYWLPTPNPDSGVFARHAFRGRRWERQSADTTVCGVEVAMATPTDLDWVRAPTCGECNRTLISELNGRT
ncbi:hypothetical protein E1181_14025 [Saccharopolyspora terrae]|uniref:Uncharacterized protein n=1 Tax=Saccharopolyspora terrae TaxID=2530384 RepID=A0A4R4VZA0_9PSEU|nr:hypothetical protein [Saccharopolyspora terrae]TDD05900.1 hypothetical protein E1181_14025 [Saccharopolyspora terrae]